MASAQVPPANFSYSLVGHARGLDLLPALISLPGGRFYACFLLFRVDCKLRHELKIMGERLRNNDFSALPLERVKLIAEEVTEGIVGYRRATTTLAAMEHQGFILSLLLARVNKTLEGACDLAESFALAADPELDRLAKELSDVL